MIRAEDMEGLQTELAAILSNGTERWENEGGATAWSEWMIPISRKTVELMQALLAEHLSLRRLAASHQQKSWRRRRALQALSRAHEFLVIHHTRLLLANLDLHKQLDEARRERSA